MLGRTPDHTYLRRDFVAAARARLSEIGYRPNEEPSRSSIDDDGSDIDVTQSLDLYGEWGCR